MGDFFQTIVDLDATAEQAPALAERAVRWLVDEGVVLAEPTEHVPGSGPGHPPGPHWNRAVTDDPDWDPSGALAVRTGRTVFTSGADMPGAALCPRCAWGIPLHEGAWQRFGDAMETWEKTGAAAVDCPACAAAVPVPEWAWDEAPLAFGHLGLEFWNWPEFTDGFRARLAAGPLEGHRTALLWGQY